MMRNGYKGLATNWRGSSLNAITPLLRGVSLKNALTFQLEICFMQKHIRHHSLSEACKVSILLPVDLFTSCIKHVGLNFQKGHGPNVMWGFLDRSS